MSQTTNDKRHDYLTRESILLLLSDDEVRRVSTAEAAPRLIKGQEYLDLEHLDEGVKVMDGVRTPMGHVLPRGAVQPATWTRILAQLPARAQGPA